jgi:glycosyltransferase involved in cell wall biosynthesis
MIVAHANHLVSSGHDVCITTAVLDTVFTIDPRITLNQLPTTNKLGTILAAFITKVDADLIIADIIQMACFLFPRSRKKVIYFAQDYDESYYSSGILRGLVRIFYHVGFSLLCIPTIAVSHPLADKLRERFHANVAVAENGVDAKVFYPDPDPELVAAKGDRKAVLLLSRNDWRKGFDIARDVVGRLFVKHSDIFEVWTVGEPCTGLFLDIVCRDFGYVGEEKLRRIMSSADLFLYPTRHEGFGLMPLEAFACGCPVVTTEAVTFASNLENALVAGVEKVEQITDFTVRALSDTVLVERITAHGVRTAKKLSLEETEEQFASAITSIMARGQRCVVAS